MPRQNFLRARASFRLRDLRSRPAWRRASVGITAEEQRNFDAFVLRRRATLDVSVQLHSYWNVSFFSGILFPFVDDRELGDGTPLERRGLLDAGTEQTTDTRRPVFADVFAELQEGEHFLVRKLTVGTMLTLRPHAALETILSATYENDAGEIRRTCGASVTASGCYLTSSDPNAQIPPQSAAQSSRLYLLADQRAESLSASTRTTLALTPRLSLQLFAQLFTEGLAYGPPLRALVAPGKSIVTLDSLRPALRSDNAPVLDERQASLTVDLVLRWEWRMGSTLYVVYQHNTAGDVASTARGQLSFPGELATLRGPTATNGDTFLLKIDFLAAL
jgi:hypothetical protein